MKRIILSIISFAISFATYSQTPQSFQYQAVVRDASGSALQSQAVNFQLSIISGSIAGPVVYSETHSAITNQFGIVSLSVGAGTPVIGSFSSITWGGSAHFIKVEADPSGGTSYLDMGITQLLSVPYALYAETSGNAGQTYTAGNGIDITGNVIANTAPDQIVNITSGTGVQVTGTYPNFSINNTQPDQTINLTGSGSTSVTGTYPNYTITSTGGTVPYTAGTGINITGTTIANTAPDQTVNLTQGGSTTITGTYPNFTISSTDNNTTYSAGTAIDITGSAISNTSPNATHTGDVTGSTALTISNNAVTTAKIADGNVTALKLNSMSATNGQVLKFNGTNWAPAADASNTYTGGTGINVAGTTITNSAPDQTVSLTQGGATTVSGTYPNFTISSTDNNTIYSAGTGMNLSGTTFNAQTTSALWNANQLQSTAVSSTLPTTNQILKFNGTSWAPGADNNTTYSPGTGINITGTTITNTAPDQTVALTQGGATTISGTYPNFTISSTDNNTTYTAGTGIGLTGTTFSSTQNLSQTLTNGNSAGTSSILMNNQSITGANIIGLGGSNANYFDLFWGHIRDYAGSHGIAGQVLTVRGISPNTYVYWENPFIGSVGTGLSLSGNTINSVWTQSGNHIYNNNTGNVGVGINNPVGKMVVKGDATALPTDPLFEVKNAAGQTVFVVYPDSVHIYVKDTGAKSNKGGFAVSGRNNAKALTHDFLYVDPDFTRVYTGDTLAGFGVQNIGTTTDNSYMQMTPKNYFIGHDAGKNTTTGKYNSFIGFQSGFTNTAGGYNVFLGYNSGYYNTASYNLFMGFEAGKNNLTGTYNSFIGYQSGYSNTIGNQNTANGYMAFNHNTSGEYNTAMGAYALHNSSTASDNTGIGNLVLYSNTIGSDNIAVGSSSLQNNITGNQNTAVGVAVLRMGTASNNNSALGYLTGYNATGSNNTFMGFSTGFNATGSNNAFMGYDAGYNSTGSNNVFIGYDAGYRTTASYDAFIGYQSGFNNTSGSQNTAIGYQTLLNNTTASYMTAIGSYALANNTTGSDNTAIGNLALYTNSVGNGNLAAGSSSLQNNTGSQNSAIGIAALRSNTTGVNNSALGYCAFYNGNFNNSTALGANTVINQSNKVRIGDASTTVIEGQVAYTWPSDGRFKNSVTEEVKGLDFITKLRPIVYNFDTRKFDAFLMKDMPDSLREAIMSKKDYSKSSSIRQTGFIAQEIEVAAKECGYDFNGLHKPENDNDNYSVAYSLFTVPLVKAVQELNTKNKELIEINNNLQKRIEALEKIVLNK